MEIKFKYENDVMHVTVSGTLSLIAANRSAKKIVATTIQHSASMVLVDGRKITGTFSATERFMHTDYFSQLVLEAQAARQLEAFRIAIASTPPVLDPQRFGETVARNRGINIYCTESMSAAREWLGEE